MTDRARLNRALEGPVDAVVAGDICCGGCVTIEAPHETYAYYTMQDVEQAFSIHGDKPVEEETRWDSNDRDEDGYPDAQTLVSDLYIGYGYRDESVFSEDGLTSIRKALVAALNGYGFDVEDPGNNAERLRITGVTDHRTFA